MNALQRIVLTTAIVATSAIVSVAAWNGLDPDNPVANTMQISQAKNVPGELIRISPPGPINGRVVVILVHGWTANGWLTRTEVEQTFSPMLLNWRGTQAGGVGIFASELQVNFDDRFVVYEYRYDTSLGPDVNGRRLGQKIEGTAELTVRGINIVLIAHSMGGLVSQQYRVIEDIKCGGLLGDGVPIDGSPATDLIAVQNVAVNLVGKKYAAQLVSTLTAGIDVNSDGFKWLGLNYLPRRRLFEQKPLDANCYLYAGGIKPAKLNWMTVGWSLAMLADAAKLQGDAYQKSMIAYPYAAALIAACGGGPSDGMVPVSSALGSGVSGKATLRKMGDYNHSEIVRGSGDLALHRQMALDLWAIYQRLHKQDAQFGKFDVALPDFRIAGSLQGFATKLDVPVKVWWQDETSVMAWDEANSKTILLAAGIDPNREVAMDSTGWQLAIPTTAGVLVVDLKTGQRHTVLSATNTTAVAWSGDQLIVVYDHGVWMMNANQQIARMLVRDDRLNVSSRPIVDKDAIYIANDAGSGMYDIYRIPVSAHGLGLGDSAIEKVESGVGYHPRRAKSAIVGIYQEGGRSKVVWLSTGFASLAGMPARPIMDKLITEDVLGSVSDIAMSQNGNVYLVIDGQICAMNMELARHYASQVAAASRTARLTGKAEGLLYIPRSELDKLIPVIGHGAHLGAL